MLNLQAQIDSVEKAIHEVKQSITASGSTAQSQTILSGLLATQTIRDDFPELQGFGLEFIQTLLTLRDLKINIRKRAVSSFYEWETLDRAVSGRREPLGSLSTSSMSQSDIEFETRHQTVPGHAQGHYQTSACIVAGDFKVQRSVPHVRRA